jgi:hypothetical protein
LISRSAFADISHAEISVSVTSARHSPTGKQASKELYHEGEERREEEMIITSRLTTSHL